MLCGFATLRAELPLESQRTSKNANFPLNSFRTIFPSYNQTTGRPRGALIMSALGPVTGLAASVGFIRGVIWRAKEPILVMSRVWCRPSAHRHAPPIGGSAGVPTPVHWLMPMPSPDVRLLSLSRSSLRCSGAFSSPSIDQQAPLFCDACRPSPSEKTHHNADALAFTNSPAQDFMLRV